MDASDADQLAKGQSSDIWDQVPRRDLTLVIESGLPKCTPEIVFVWADTKTLIGGSGGFTRSLSTYVVPFAWMGPLYVDRSSATEVLWRRRNLGAQSANVPRGP
jgi:hypothetical protein